MFTLTYSTPTTGEVSEQYATLAEAEAAGADVRASMVAVGFGAHADSIRIDEGVEGATPALQVSVDRDTINARGRSATVFVAAPADTSPADVRSVASAHLQDGERLTFEGTGRTNDDGILLREFAVHTI